MTLIAVLFVIPVMLFVAPFVLGSYAAVQNFSARGQMAYFGFCTLFFVAVTVVGAAILLLNAV